MSASPNPDLSKLNELLDRCPHIRHATPSSPEYASLSTVFVIDDSIKPLMVVRPQSSSDVACLISVLTTNSIPFTIRSGGHDMFCRSIASNTVTIDMRDINFVHIDKSSLTARVGGGILSGHFAAQLNKENLVTAFPQVPDVGYVGWATHGGYGSLSSNHGLGADQIVGANVVNYEGKLVEADEKLLKAIRGGGGAFGAIVDLTIKVYQLDSVLGGIIIYKSDDVASSIKQYNSWYQTACEAGLPSALTLQQGVINNAGLPALTLFVLWSSSDLEEGNSWVQKVCSAAPVALNTVTKTTIPDWMTSIRGLIKDRIYGSICSIGFRVLSAEVIEVLCRCAEKIASDPNTSFWVHELRKGPSTTPHPDSIFPIREPHFTVEILSTAESEEGLENSKKLAKEFHMELQTTSAENILPPYLAFTSPNDLDLRQIYGEQYDDLVAIKREYDPVDVYRYACARF